jgi:hypothetical protein
MLKSIFFAVKESNEVTYNLLLILNVFISYYKK